MDIQWGGRLLRALADPSRRRLLQVLHESAEPLDARKLGELAGLHPTTVRFHLDVLVDAKLATREKEARTAPGRPRVLYRATPTPLQEDLHRVLGPSAQPLAAPSDTPRAGGSPVSANPAPPLLEQVAEPQHPDQIITRQQQQLEAHEQVILALRSRIRDLEQLLLEGQLHGGRQSRRRRPRSLAGEDGN